MWGRDNNFQVSTMYELLNCENKISLTKVFIVHPLYIFTHHILYILPTSVLGFQNILTEPSIIQIVITLIILAKSDEREEKEGEAGSYQLLF